MQKSAIQLKIEAQLQASVDLLKQAKRYVGQSNTIGGQDLSREITEFVASVDRNPAAIPLTAEMVRELRTRTGEGLMACKAALVATGGDFDAAVDHLRCAGQCVVRITTKSYATDPNPQQIEKYAPRVCRACGQADTGQMGEYPCVQCGVPTTHDPQS